MLLRIVILHMLAVAKTDLLLPCTTRLSGLAMTAAW